VSISNLVLIIVCVTGISAGQILFKLASESIPTRLVFTEWLQFASNKFFLSALVIYGAATILWILALKRIDLFIAYPFMALAFIIVPCAGYLFLNEPVTYKTFIGAVLIIAGLIISVY